MLKKISLIFILLVVPFLTQAQKKYRITLTHVAVFAGTINHATDSLELGEKIQDYPDSTFVIRKPEYKYTLIAPGDISIFVSAAMKVSKKKLDYRVVHAFQKPGLDPITDFALDQKAFIPEPRPYLASTLEVKHYIPIEEERGLVFNYTVEVLILE